MQGVFALWQPRYAEKGIATFPVREKKPAVKGYLRIGLPASSEFAAKFREDHAFGFACRRNRITVLDVDTPDEKLLADAMSEVGPTPFIVRSGSGNYQAWYRHNGERRRVRPDPERPIDILGDGFVVAPPSVTAKGRYEIICGTLDDLDSLPTMRPRPEPIEPVPAPTKAMKAPSSLIDTGRRNNELWKFCMVKARQSGTIRDLMEVAMQANAQLFYEPLPDSEVLKVVASAWAKEIAGENWFGRGGRVVLEASDIDGLLTESPDAFVLLTILRRNHWGRKFVIANEMASSMPGGGWRRQRFAAARQHLLNAQYIEETRPASRQHGPAVYAFKGGQN